MTAKERDAFAELTGRTTMERAKLKTAQETDQMGTTLPAGTIVTKVGEGEYVSKDGLLCCPKPEDLSPVRAKADAAK